MTKLITLLIFMLCFMPEINAQGSEVKIVKGENNQLFYYLDDQLLIKSKLKNSVDINNFEAFNHQGELTTEYIYGKKSDFYVTYYPNGNVNAYGFLDKNNNRVECWVYFYENGALDRRIEYQNGMISNIKGFYDDALKLKYMVRFNQDNHGNLVGNMQTYFKSGKVFAKGNLMEGKKVGVWAYYNDYGQLFTVKDFDSFETFAVN